MLGSVLGQKEIFFITCHMQHMICHINATFSMFINKNIKGEMISPGNYNPPFEWKDGSGPGSMVRPVVTSFIWPM